MLASANKYKISPTAGPLLTTALQSNELVSRSCPSMWFLSSCIYFGRVPAELSRS